ncbi:MAG: hypothetical protein VX690_03745 [Pseudomonadota bacterium]|nr:hypothetical protein [Pseudomonadota bacterium]
MKVDAHIRRMKHLIGRMESAAFGWKRHSACFESGGREFESFRVRH